MKKKAPPQDPHDYGQGWSRYRNLQESYKHERMKNETLQTRLATLEAQLEKRVAELITEAEEPVVFLSFTCHCWGKQLWAVPRRLCDENMVNEVVDVPYLHTGTPCPTCVVGFLTQNFEARRFALYVPEASTVERRHRTKSR